MLPATSDFVLQQLIPALGVLTGTFMSFAPYRSVLKASREGTLGDLNATPWVFMLGNCLGWVAYAFVTRNVYVFLPNGPGLVLAIWLNIQAIKLQYENFRSLELQNSIITALENLDTVQMKQKSRGQLVSKDEVSKLVEHVIVEEHPPTEILDPITTAPVDEALNDPLDTSTEYEAIKANNDVEDVLRPSPTLLESNENNDDDGMSVQAATEILVDYANFIWEIAAQKTPAPVSHELMVVGISTFWLVLITFVVFELHGKIDSLGVLVIGIAVNINLIFFYGAPLSKISSVLATRSSTSIHRPTMVFSLINGILWFVYGIAVKDVFIAVPNGFGASLGVLQLALCALFPKHSHSRSSMGFEAKDVSSSADTSSLSLPEESTPLI